MEKENNDGVLPVGIFVYRMKEKGTLWVVDVLSKAINFIEISQNTGNKS